MVTSVKSQLLVPQIREICVIRVTQNSLKIQNRKSDVTPCDGAVTPCVTP
jgi:hypothetical protein